MCHESTPQDESRATLSLLALAANYRKAEIDNPFLRGLRSLSAPDALHGMASCISRYLTESIEYDFP